MENTITTDAKPINTNDKFIPPFGFDMAAITSRVTKFLDSEKAIPFLEKHKSGVVVASLWLTLHIRSWLSVLPLPIPSLATLPLVLLALVSLSLTTPTRTLTGVAHYASSEISSSITSLSNKILPDRLPHIVLIALIFPVGRAVTLLFLLGAWEIVSKYRDGVAGVAKEADESVRRATSASEKAREAVREAKGLGMQAVQLAAAANNNNNNNNYSYNRNNFTSGAAAAIPAAREVKAEVEEMAKDTERLEAKVDKVKKLVERAKAVAEEGDLELAREMVTNAGTLIERVVRGETGATEKVEELKKRLWGLSLGECSG